MKIQLNNIINEDFKKRLDSLMDISQKSFSTHLELKGEVRGTSTVYLLIEDSESNLGYCKTIASNYKTQLISNVQCIELDENGNRIYVTSKVDAEHSVSTALSLTKYYTVTLNECTINNISNGLSIIILIKKE